MTLASPLSCHDAAVDPDAAEVKASGGVVWRRAGDGRVELAVVHRPRYDDWSLPKGKLDPGETWEDAALREVEEEVGLRCRLGEELPPVGYRDNKGRAKAVRYWLMEPDDSDGRFTPNDEVDEMRWLDVAAAVALLSYPHDAELVRAAGERL
jgi:8-oxo-dGTP diphosphatase